MFGPGALERLSTYMESPASFFYVNGWRILFFVAFVLWMKTNVVQPKVSSYRQQKSLKEAKDPDRVAAFNAHMRRVRAVQQEEAMVQARLAKVEADKKKAEQLKAKRIQQPQHEKGGRTLGRTTGSGGYNPLLGDSSGPNYRPARRSVNRGG